MGVKLREYICSEMFLEKRTVVVTEKRERFLRFCSLYVAVLKKWKEPCWTQLGTSIARNYCLYLASLNYTTVSIDR